MTYVHLALNSIVKVAKEFSRLSLILYAYKFLGKKITIGNSVFASWLLTRDDVFSPLSFKPSASSCALEF